LFNVRSIWIDAIFIVTLTSTLLMLPPVVAGNPPFNPSPPFFWTLTIHAFNKDTDTKIPGVQIRVQWPDEPSWPPRLGPFQGWATTAWGPGQGGEHNMPELLAWWTFLAPETLQYNETHRKKFNHWEIMWQSKNAEVVKLGRIIRVRALSQSADVGIEARYHEERCGPKIDTLYFKMFFCSAAEWTALKAGDIDLMDWPLSKQQYNEWVIGQAPGVDIAKTKDHGIFEIDINCNKTVTGLPGAVYTYPNWDSPTSVKSFRQALALMLDKVAVNSVDFGGMAEILDVPLPAPIHASYINGTVVNMWRVSGGQWYVPPNDLTKAAAKLNADGFVQGITPNPYYDPTMPGSAPYMRVYPPGHQKAGQDLDPIIFYIKACSPDRVSTGARLTDMMRKSGIPVQPVTTTASVCYRQVKQVFGYHLYTGGWKLNQDPDHLHDFFTSELANPFDYNYLLFNGQGPQMPYTFTWDATNGMGPPDESVTYLPGGGGSGVGGKWHYPDPAPWNGALFEQALDEVKNPVNQANLIKACQFVQEVLWGTDALIPNIPHSRYSPSYTAYRRGWKDLVNEEGQGIVNRWSTMGGYNTATNTMRVGLAYTVESLNPVAAEWYWDWLVLEQIYDGLLGAPQPRCQLTASDPYTPTNDLPVGLAEWWDVGTWNDGGVTKTLLKFRLRENLKWHDGTHVTIDDVAFSFLYHQAQFAWWYGSAMSINDVATRNGGVPPAAATATWTTDPTLGSDEITVKLDVLSLFGLHWIGFMPILMQRIWQNVPDAYAYNPIADDADGSGTIDIIEDGTGPFKFFDFVTDDHVTLKAFRDYFLTTPQITDFKKEAFHRVGDVDYNAVVDIPDLAAVAGGFSLNPYPSPASWVDDHYSDMTYWPPAPGDPYPTGRALPFDMWSDVGCKYTRPTRYPWDPRDLNYDYYIKIEDLVIVAKNFKRNSGSGPGW